MDQLGRLGMQDRWIYEVLISTFRRRNPPRGPHRRMDQRRRQLSMDVYNGSQTLATILDGGDFAANFPADAAMLHMALRAPEQLGSPRRMAFMRPLSRDARPASSSSLSNATPRGDRVRLAGDVRRVHLNGPPRLINRAEGLLLESLVLATRLERPGANSALTTLIENYRIVGKVAPGSAYERALAALLQDLGPTS